MAGTISERAYQRAKQMGWIPSDAQLTPRPATLASWDAIPDDEKPFQRRFMEVFAGFTEHVDVQIGRIVDEIDGLRVRREHARSLYLR